MRNGSNEDGVAIVLAGAVAQGAFAVGVLSYVAEKETRPMRRIAATSSGALTGAVIAAGVATGRFREATKIAMDMWLDHGAWNDVLRLSPADWLHARGASNTSKLSSIVAEGIRRVVGDPPGATRQPVELTLVTTSLNGIRGANEPLPTYECPASFGTAELVDPRRWLEIATAAAASATFPGVFAPTSFGGARCIDGGAVNNAPISYVLRDSSVKRVILITSESTALDPSSQFGGAHLVGKVAEIIINERVAHDLAVAQKTNARLAAVTKALADTSASPATTQAVLDALGWRELDLVPIYPDPPLKGTSFSGFSDKDLRKQYIDAGVRAAKRALG
jgi:NTE family protein